MPPCGRELLLYRTSLNQTGIAYYRFVTHNKLDFERYFFGTLNKDSLFRRACFLYSAEEEEKKNVSR